MLPAHWSGFSKCSLLFGKLSWGFRTEKGKMQNKPGPVMVPERKEVLKKCWGHVPRSQEPTWKNSQQPKGENLSNKINNKSDLWPSGVKWIFHYGRSQIPKATYCMNALSGVGHAGEGKTTGRESRSVAVRSRGCREGLITKGQQRKLWGPRDCSGSWLWW